MVNLKRVFQQTWNVRVLFRNSHQFNWLTFTSKVPQNIFQNFTKYQDIHKYLTSDLHVCFLLKKKYIGSIRKLWSLVFSGFCFMVRLFHTKDSPLFSSIYLLMFPFSKPEKCLWCGFCFSEYLWCHFFSPPYLANGFRRQK